MIFITFTTFVPKGTKVKLRYNNGTTEDAETSQNYSYIIQVINDKLIAFCGDTIKLKTFAFYRIMKVELPA